MSVSGGSVHFGVLPGSWIAGSAAELDGMLFLRAVNLGRRFLRGRSRGSVRYEMGSLGSGGLVDSVGALIGSFGSLVGEEVMLD